MFCSAKHRFEALFTKWTQVSDITHVPQNLHRYAYRLRYFQNILANVMNKTFLCRYIEQ